MESLTLDENNAGGGPQQQQQQPAQHVLGSLPQNQQLPPQMFTTAAQLLDMTDKKLMVALRDGRKLIGVLRSWDQFANLVLQQTIERIFVPPPTPSPSSTPNKTNSTSTSTSTLQPGLYADIPHGIFLVRGENVLLLGEIDLDKEDDPPAGYERADIMLVHNLNKERKVKEASREKFCVAKLKALGFEGEGTGEASL